MNNKVVILIPVYKEILNEFEQKSLNQCVKVLGNYTIYFIKPNHLDISVYDKYIHNKIKLQSESFSDSFFYNINGYNKLMLSYNFYERFKQYEFMLIYQLDAYVFSDKLLEWCNKNYDYVGSPIVGEFYENEFSYNFRVGNGGFSLRKIDTFIRAFEHKKRLLSSKELIMRYNVLKKPLKRIPLFFLMFIGWRNSFSYHIKKWKYNEDDFWSSFLDNTTYSLKKPSFQESFEFAFERFPSNLFQITGKLPFGCHAWEKYEYETFWRNYIY